MKGEAGMNSCVRASMISAPFLSLIIVVISAFLLDFNYGRSLCVGLLAALVFARKYKGKNLPRPPIHVHTSSYGQACLELARRNSRFRLSAKGDEYYCRAVEYFFKHDDLESGLEAFSEYFDNYKGVFEPRFQLRICKELCNQGFYELSAEALETLIERWDEVSMGAEMLWKEKAYMRLGKILAEKLECIDYARFILLRFLKEFPGSRFREIVEYQIVALQAKRAQNQLKRA